ncbi:unnamed protein product [Parnassius mnemosyne]|uniref:Uncharacterized protein n=1 Tax=Parnassius mnemosyne TaxID=213953 RepID=A0AAV1L2M7_9NEOP
MVLRTINVSFINILVDVKFYVIKCVLDPYYTTPNQGFELRVGFGTSDFTPLLVATTSRTTSTPGTSTQSMENEIAELKAAVKNLTMQLSRRSRPCDRSSIRNRRRSTSRSDSSYRRYPTCWYHSKYGDKANRCIKPCDFGKSGNARSSR